MSITHPNYYDRADRELYNQLFYFKKNGEKLSDEEWEFCKTMYHMEEFACGLDGDRDDE